MSIWRVYNDENSKTDLLSLSIHVSNVTDDGVVFLSYLWELEYLSMNDCTKLTDAGIASITARLRWLRGIDLGDNDQLTDETLRRLASMFQR